MSLPSYIWHVTLDTGHGRRSPRSEVSDDVLAHVRDLIAAALDGNHPALPVPGFRLSASAAGGGLIATVLADIGQDKDVPILTVGVARKSLGAGRLWTVLHKDRIGIPTPLATDVGDVPAAPWVAARFEIGIIAVSNPGWLGDFERVLAWAWLETRRSG